VTIVEHDGRRWLVGPYGTVPWVHNARAAGRVCLSRRLDMRHYDIRKASALEAEPVLKRYVAVATARKYFQVTRMPRKRSSWSRLTGIRYSNSFRSARPVRQLHHSRSGPPAYRSATVRYATQRPRSGGQSSGLCDALARRDAPQQPCGRLRRATGEHNVGSAGYRPGVVSRETATADTIDNRAERWLPARRLRPSQLRHHGQCDIGQHDAQPP
jgi:hypothetical protein